MPACLLRPSTNPGVQRCDVQGRNRRKELHFSANSALIVLVFGNALKLRPCTAQKTLLSFTTTTIATACRGSRDNPPGRRNHIIRSLVVRTWRLVHLIRAELRIFCWVGDLHIFLKQNLLLPREELESVPF